LTATSFKQQHILGYRSLLSMTVHRTLHT